MKLKKKNFEKNLMPGENYNIGITNPLQNHYIKLETQKNIENIKTSLKKFLKLDKLVKLHSNNTQLEGSYYNSMSIYIATGF